MFEPFLVEFSLFLGSNSAEISIFEVKYLRDPTTRGTTLLKVYQRMTKISKETPLGPRVGVRRPSWWGPLTLREVFKKSKYKFKMAFAMKGGGSRGGLECHIPILKNDFFESHLESFPDC